MNINKFFIILSCLICILSFQNCGPTGFESSKLNTNLSTNSVDPVISDGSTPEAEPEVSVPAVGEAIVEPVMIAPELPAFKFSEFKAEINDLNQVTVSWKQSVAGTGQVSYGVLESDLNILNAKEEMDLTYHTQIIRKGLEANTTYYFKATSIIAGDSFDSKIIKFYFKGNETPPVKPVEGPSESMAKGDVATHCDETKPLCGIMYGVAISGESYGHTRQFRHSSSIRFQSEKTGTITAYKYHNRVYRKTEWDRDDNGDGFNEKYKCKNSDPICKMKGMKSGGYHMGNGGLLSFAIHADNGNGEPSTVALARGTKTLVPTGNKHFVGTYEGIKYYVGDNTLDRIEWDKPVKLQLGKYYHIVTRQLEPQKGMVVLNGFYSHHPGTRRGGPYYGNRFTVITKGSASQAWRKHEKVFPDFKLYYTDGTVAGPGNDGVAGQYSRYKVSGKQMMRQVFTMDYKAQMTGLWVRLNRLSGKSPLIITVKNSNGSEVVRVSSAAAKVPNTFSNPVQGLVEWVYNKFPAPISLIEGRKYFVEFKANSDTAYQLQTEETYDYNGGVKLSKESVWKGSADRAEFSTNGENSFKPVPRSVKDLSVLFTISGKPELIN